MTAPSHHAYVPFVSVDKMMKLVLTLGIERVLELLKEQSLLPQQNAPDAYAVVPDPAQLAKVMPVLRKMFSASLDFARSLAGSWLEYQSK